MRTLLRLHSADAEALADALENPPEPTKALQKLMLEDPPW